MASTSSEAINNVGMTKVYIFPAKKSFDPAIRQHFGQFGKVQSIAYYSKRKFGYAFVQFENAESASAAIAESKHEIDGEIVKAKAAHSQQQTQSVSSPSKPQKTTDANIAEPKHKIGGKTAKAKVAHSQQHTPSVSSPSKPQKSATAAIAEPKQKVGGKKVKAKAAHKQQQTPSACGPSKPQKSNVAPPIFPRQTYWHNFFQHLSAQLHGPRRPTPTVIGLSESEMLSGACPIDKLNEDCLREIFKRLNIVDRLSAADVCNKFRKVAKDLVKPAEYLNLKMNSNISLPLLRLFATEIESIELQFGLLSCYGISLVLDRIATIGSNPNSKLTKISISEWKINEKFVKRLKPLFSRITSLSIDHAAKNDKSITELLNVCTELKELELEYISFAHISKIKFPKLETFIISETPQLRDNMVDRFLSSHRQLKTLSMDWNTKLTSNAFRNLNSNIEKLELLGEIKLSPNLDELNGLTSLKSLAIEYFSFSSVKSLVKKGLPIEELYLSGLDLDGSVINDIKSLKHLKKLKLSYDELNDNDLLVGMVKALPQLKSIDLDSYGEEIGIKRIKKMVKSAPELEYVKFHREDGVVIDSQDFESILASVQCRPNKTKLTVVLSGDACKLKVPKEVIKKSREWLEFDVDDYNKYLGFNDFDSYSGSDSDEYDFSNEYDSDSDEM